MSECEPEDNGSVVESKDQKWIDFIKKTADSINADTACEANFDIS